MPDASAYDAPTEPARLGGVGGGTFFNDFGFGAGGGAALNGEMGAFGFTGDRLIVPGGDGLDEKLDRDPIEDLRRDPVGLVDPLDSRSCRFFQKSLDFVEVTSSSRTEFS